MEKTFAQIAEKLSKKESKYQKMLEDSSTDAQKNAARLMLNRVLKAKEDLMDENRAAAEEAAIHTPSFKSGGQVPKYLPGGPVSPVPDPGIFKRPWKYNDTLGNFFYNNVFRSDRPAKLARLSGRGSDAGK